MTTRILVIGRSGQLATELARLPCPPGVVLEAVGRERCDLSKTAEIKLFLRESRPGAVINAAAYTAVDKAETDQAAAFALNRDGPAALARACAEMDLPLIHLSTDYVFDGAKVGPYLEGDPKAPLNVYGRSKSEGEDAVLASGARALVLRTSWVYAAQGENFLRTMLKAAETREQVEVVADQMGRPTWARDLAETSLALCVRALDREPAARGLFHYAGAGDARWADFAEAIFAAASARGAKGAHVRRVTSAAYYAGRPNAAPRPRNSRLDTAKIETALSIRPRDWREACEMCVAELLSR